MPSRKLFTAIAAPAVLTLASVAPALGGTQAGTASAAPAKPALVAGAAPQPRLRHGRRPRLGRPEHRPDQRRLRQRLQRDARSSTSSRRRGRVFTEAYASVQCSPTRTALHTGQYATRPTNNVYAVSGIAGPAGDPLRGVTQGRLAEDGRTAVPVGYTTIGETLQGAGYATGYSGKFHVAGSADEIVASHGFDENWGGSQNSHATYYFATNDQFNDSVSPTLDQFAADYTQDYVDANIAPYSHGVSEAQLDALVGTDKHVTDAQTDAAHRLHRPQQGRAVLRLGQRVRAALPGQRRPGPLRTCSRSTAPRRRARPPRSRRTAR